MRPDRLRFLYSLLGDGRVGNHCGAGNEGHDGHDGAEAIVIERPLIRIAHGTREFHPVLCRPAAIPLMVAPSA
jgi:hypothetical protein